MSDDFDSQRSHLPFSFVMIGGEFAIVKDYDLNLTARGEASSANINIALEQIDSKAFVKFENDDVFVPIEIYSGYMLDAEDFTKQFGEIINLIKLGQIAKQKKFRLRFDGFAAQPEWTFGDERMLTLNCFDWSQVLREYKWDRNLQDGETEVRTVIKLVQERVKGIKIIADSYSGSLKLGDKDLDTKKWSYHASGKKIFELLEDCAEKMGKNIFVIGKNIYITKYKEQPVIWNYYYGEQDSPVYKASENMTPFKSVKLRIGQVGETQKSNVVVDLYSRTTSKKGKVSATHVRYPENAQLTNLTKHITRNLKNNLSEHELKVYAEQIWKKESKKVMTGNIDVEFANPFVDLYDIATFKCSDDQVDMKYIDGIWFSINSINERYSADGWTQTMDIDSSIEIKNSLRERKVPDYVPQKLDRIGYTPVTVGDTSKILSKRLGL